MLRLACVSLPLLLAACAVVADDKKAFDAKNLVGKWQFVSGMRNGVEAKEEMKKAEFEISKDTMTLVNGGETFKFKYTLDEKTSPVGIDLEITESPFGPGAKARGIVSVEGDECKLCYDGTGGDRPKKFDGKEAYLFVLKRAKK